MGLLKSASVVSALTLLSRITGMLRESAIAYFFGASALTDAFNVAFRIPNLLRRIFAEGAFSQAFVPILAAKKSQLGAAATKLLINHVATLLFWAVLLTTVIGIIFAPSLVLLLASGLERHSSLAASAMTRMMFPYILCMAMIALMASVLNTWRRFAIPAFSPLLLNVAMLLGMAAGVPLLRHYGLEPIYALACSAMLGGLLQLGLHTWALRRMQLQPRIALRPAGLRSAWADHDSGRILKLMGPALLGVSVGQLSLLINTQIASHLPPGSVTWLSLADRLMEFPTALVGVALGVVLMPRLAEARAQNATEQYAQMVAWGLRLVLLLGLPCAVALLLYAQPIVAGFYHYGRFQANDVAQTSLAVMGYGVGILGFLIIKILAPAYYAQQNIRTPVKIAVVVLIFSQLLNFIFVPWLGHAGLALSIACAALLNALWLFIGLLRTGHIARAGWWPFLLRLMLVNALLALALWWLSQQTWHGHIWWSGNTLPKGLRLTVLLASCAAVAVGYVALLYATGLHVHRVLRSPV